MIEKKEFLFSYGTLQQEKVQVELFGRLLQGAPDILEGYRLRTIEITDKSFLSKGEEKLQQTLVISNDKSDRVHGAVFEVTEGDLMQADNYEPDGFKRAKVILNSGKNAWIYLAVT